MDNFETILNSLPAKPARSRLDPYSDLIRELLSRGWTYREIARILLEKCGVHISISTIHHFVHTRSRSKRKLPKSHPQNLEKNTVVPATEYEEKQVASIEKGSAIVMYISELPRSSSALCHTKKLPLPSPTIRTNRFNSLRRSNITIKDFGNRYFLFD